MTMRQDSALTTIGQAVANPQIMGFSKAVEMFSNAQDVKRSSSSLYKRTLRLFVDWVRTTGRDANALQAGDIVEYKRELLERGLSSLSVASYLTSLRKFYAWTEGNGIYPDIAKSVHTPKRVQAFKKQHLTERKCSELLDYFRGVSLRDYAMVNLMLRTGLRTIEVSRADIGDITFKGDVRILRVWGKGRDSKDDFVVLTDKAFEPIKEYLETERRRAKASEPLFVSDSNRNEGGRLTTRTISGICKDGLKAIGLDGREFTAHSLRHTAAVMILKHGGAVTDAQVVLRHASPTTTEIYTESIKEELRLAKAPEEMIDEAF